MKSKNKVEEKIERIVPNDEFPKEIWALLVKIILILKQAGGRKGMRFKPEVQVGEPQERLKETLLLALDVWLLDIGVHWSDCFGSIKKARGAVGRLLGRADILPERWQCPRFQTYGQLAQCLLKNPQSWFGPKNTLSALIRRNDSGSLSPKGETHEGSVPA